MYRVLAHLLLSVLAISLLILSWPGGSRAAAQKDEKKEKERKNEPFKTEKLTQGMGLHFIGSVSPDKKSVLIIAQKPDSAPNLYFLRLGDFSISQPATTFKWGVADPCWSPDGSQIALAGFDEAGSFSEIYRLDLKAGTMRRLTRNNFSDKEPVFTPDGKRILYTTDESPLPDAAFGILHIGAVATGGGKSEYFTEDETSSIKPGTTADGKSVLLVKVNEHSGRHSLWQYGLDGKPEQDLTERKFARIHGYVPSPAADKIVLWAQEEPERQETVYILDLKSKQITSLPDDDLPKRRPAISPDGKRIVFVGPSKRGGQLFLFDSATGEMKQITYLGFNAHSPVFISEDKILFGYTTRAEERELFVLDLSVPIPEDEKKK
ncbi:MAG: hypothetical protein L0229_15085 [Blastocatellia bacterium]|nr:hypothetical protein [Blastocatellia bacterium]